MSTQIYSWRVSADLKTGLEREAQRRGLSLSAVLDMAARDWMTRSQPDPNDNEEQLRLHAAAAKCFGTFAGGNPDRSTNARTDLRQRLRKRATA